MPADLENLTGDWFGAYAHPDEREPTPFTATLDEGPGGGLTGTTQEVAGDNPARGSTLRANLVGGRQGRNVSFVKTYVGAASFEHHSWPVEYEGVLSEDGTEIDGRWSIGGWLSDWFLIARSRPPAETVAVERQVESVA